MDEIVKLAMARWPNVPDCYGWLALDARGVWRMRDERAQALQLAGDAIRHPTLLAFINRNYQADAQGRWYFQNGPQRVFVNLSATPYIAHTSPECGLILHTGLTMPEPQAAWMNRVGQLFLAAEHALALLDDRDLDSFLPCILQNGAAIEDQALMDWLQADQPEVLNLQLPHPYHACIRLQHAELSDLRQQFGFVAQPVSD